MKWHELARIVIVYLREAHALDEWPMGNHVQVTQAKTLAERAETARRFVAATCLEVDAVFIDGMEDIFTHRFSAHPQRFYVVDDCGVLRLIATPCEGCYSLADVDRALEDVCHPR